MTLSKTKFPGFRELFDFVYVMLPKIEDPDSTLRWHIQNLGVVADRDYNYHNTLQGIALFRRLNTPEESFDRWFVAPQGKGLWIDWTVSLLQGGMGRMAQTIFETLGESEWVGFSRHKHGDRISVYPASFFDRLARIGV